MYSRLTECRTLLAVWADSDGQVLFVVWSCRLPAWAADEIRTGFVDDSIFDGVVNNFRLVMHSPKLSPLTTGNTRVDAPVKLCEMRLRTCSSHPCTGGCQLVAWDLLTLSREVAVSGRLVNRSSSAFQKLQPHLWSLQTSYNLENEPLRNEPQTSDFVFLEFEQYSRVETRILQCWWTYTAKIPLPEVDINSEDRMWLSS